MARPCRRTGRPCCARPPLTSSPNPSATRRPARRVRNLRIALGLILALPARGARADGLSIQITAGASTLHVTAAQVFDRDAGFGLEVRPQINFEFTNFNSDVFIAYQGRYGSNFGSFPLGRTGAGVQYYPAGFPLTRTMLDNGVLVNENRFAPFVVGSLGFAVVAVTDASSASQSFNALTIGYQVGAGGELPVASNKSAVIELLMDGTMAGGTSGANATAVSVRAYSVLVGFSIHP